MAKTISWSNQQTHSGAWYSSQTRVMSWSSSSWQDKINTINNENGIITKLVCTFTCSTNLSANISGTCKVYNSSGAEVKSGYTGEISSSSTKTVSWSDLAGTTIGSLAIHWNANVWVTRKWYCTAKLEWTYEPTYSVTANSGGNGTVSLSGIKQSNGRYTSGTTLTLKATPNTGYKFTKWSDGNTSATRNVTVTGNATYTAYFEKLTYTVTATAGAGGTVSGGGTYEYGASVTLTATPSEGYKFVQWSDGNTSAKRTFTVTGNASLTASFVLIEYTLTDNSQNGYIYDSTNSCAIGSRTYHYKDVISLVPTPNTGYTFKSWQDTGATTNPRSYTVTGNAVLAANFSANHKSVCYLGDIAATKIYIGDKAVMAVYIGDTQVW